MSMWYMVLDCDQLLLCPPVDNARNMLDAACAIGTYEVGLGWEKGKAAGAALAGSKEDLQSVLVSGMECSPQWPPLQSM